MSFIISGLDPEPFMPLFALDDVALASRRARRCLVTEDFGFPCRVTLEDASIGETVLLVNYEHQAADSPFRASHAIYVRETAERAARYVDAVPDLLRMRKTLSIRAFDAAGMLVAAEVTAGEALEGAIQRLFGDAVDYLHVHSAAPGCYLARVDRAGTRLSGTSQ